MTPQYLPKWERPECYIGKTWHGWYIGLSVARSCSDIITESNYEVFLKKLRELPEKSVLEPGMRAGIFGTGDQSVMEIATVQEVGESHWAFGHCEWIAIHESDTEAVALADEMLRQLDSYPILDEDDYFERCDVAIHEHWAGVDFLTRIDWCRDNGDSLFAARHTDRIPEGVYQYLRDTTQ